METPTEELECITRSYNGKGIVETEKWINNPDKPGYMKLEKKYTIEEVFKGILTLLPEYGIEVDENRYFVGKLDYFDITLDYKYLKTKASPFPNYHWLACYVVTGNSEGYYLHIDTIDKENKRIMVFLGKALGAREDAEEVCLAISRILNA